MTFIYIHYTIYYYNNSDSVLGIPTYYCITIYLTVFRFKKTKYGSNNHHQTMYNCQKDNL